MEGKEGCRVLGPTELYSSRCHNAGGNMNITLALTVHTRAPLDLGLVKITLQELQHQFPQLTSRLRQDQFCPMECPILPLDTHLLSQDMIHDKFDTERGPLWRVQIITQHEMEKANLKFGPELEAILEDDSSLETRWRYLLRYFQGRLNQDIENFQEEQQAAEEEGRSVVVMSFHPSITDMTGAFYLARQFMSLLDLLIDSEGPLQLGQPEAIPPSVETLLPSPDSAFQLGDFFPMVKAVGSHFVATRRSPLESLVKGNEEKEEQGGRSLFLRGWLTEAETAEVLALCEEDDVTLHGLVLAAGLTAVARLCHGNSPPTTATSLRAAISTNLRQYCSPAPRNGLYTAPYEETYSVPPVVDSEDLWRLAHQLSMQHNTAKSTRQPLQKLRMYSKMFSAPGGGDAAFRDMETTRRVSSEMGLAVHGDLGHIFRRESSADELSSWTRHEQPTVQVKLEDVFPMAAGQHMGSPFSHSAHIYQSRLNYILGYHTTYVGTPQALQLRDETMAILRMAVEH